VLITVSGLDGAGKSTVINGLRGELERQGRGVVVLHMNDHVGIYACARAIRDRMFGRARLGVETPPRMTPRATRFGRLRDAIVWNKPLRRFFYPLDLLYFAALRLYFEGVRRRTLILDRYFYDRLVDVAPSSPDAAGWKWLRLLARMTPAPDLAVWLEISPARAFARKSEYTIPYLEQRDAAYRTVFGWLPATIKISSDSLQIVQGSVAEAARRRSESRDTRLRTAALRLLIDPTSVDPDELDWAELRPVAERGGVIVRLADALTRRGETLAPRFAAAAARACARTQQALEVMDRLGERCTQLGIAHAFLKAVERYPDTGRDVDLLIADPSPAVDRLILRDLPAAPRARGFRTRLSGSRTYTAAHDIVIDIHHARLGRFGEQARYARTLVERASVVPVGPTACVAPSPEDHFLLVATQQVYTRPALRLADVYWAVTMLRRDDQLRWDYLFAAALAMGMLPAVGAYLAYVDRVHTRLLGRTLLTADLLARFEAPPSVPQSAQAGIRFPAVRTVRQLYVKHIHATLEAGRWHSAARLSLLPVAAALAAGGGGGSRRSA